jgi:hypothetical protein
MTKADAVTIAEENDLAQVIDSLLSSPHAAAERAAAFARHQGEGILARVVAALEPVIASSGTRRGGS